MIINKTTRSRSTQRKKGFTLTEIAIVLGIMGLILGAIWTAAAGVYSNQKEAKLQSEVLTVVQGVRSLYATSTVGDIAGTNITTTLINAGIFPSDMYSGANGLTPYAGASGLAAFGGKITTDGDGFIIEITSIPQAACVNILNNLGGNGRDSGLVLATAAKTTNAATSAGTAMTATTFPITASGANTTCTAASTAGTAGFVDFGFKLKG